MAVKASATITLNSVVDIKATYRYYLLQSSTASKPAKPTTNPPGGSWTDAEPTYTSGSTNSLYFVDLTVFTNYTDGDTIDKGTFSYSNVSLSTAYEASKEAYNIAQNAQKSVDNLEIGGRNLFSGYGEEEIQLNNYQNTGSFTQFSNHLTFDPCETVGENYTISFWAKSPNGSTPLSIYNSNGNSEGPRHFYFSGRTLTKSLGTEWEYFKTTVTNIDRGETYPDTFCNRIEIYAPNQMGVLVKKIKVEKGDKATDWTPAPEDVDDTIDDANNKADQLIEWQGGAQTDIKSLKDVIYFLAVGEHGEATDFSQFADGFSFSFAKTNQDIANTNSDLKIATDDIEVLRKFMNENKDYINFTTIDDGNGGTEPCIELGVKGNTTGSKFKIRITNTRIMFMEDADIPTYISNKTLITERVEVKQELAQSGFVWKKRSNGNYGLSWKGV